MQLYLLCGLDNMTDSIHSTVFSCCLGGSMGKLVDIIKMGNKANEQSKMQCKKKHY